MLVPLYQNAVTYVTKNQLLQWAKSHVYQDN